VIFLYKKLGVGLLFAILSVSIAKTTYAQISTENVRIGLEAKYKSVTSVPITDNGIMFGYQVNGFYSPETALNSSSGFSMRSTDNYYVKISNTYTTYEQALKKAIEMNASGVKAAPASLGNRVWSVYCGGYSSSEAQNMLSRISGGTIVSPNGKRTELINGQGVMLICDNSEAYPTIAPLSSEAITLSDRKYRGQIEFNRAQGNITVINVVNIEDYLRSVVPSEMPASWGVEALKAQAVAARTYTSRTRKHDSQEYDLCDGTHCQAYVGYTNENSNTTIAVNQTHGQKIYYNDELIQASYFSSSGGYTANSENVWVSALPYLRAVPDPYDTQGKVWTRTFTVNDLNTLLNNKSINIGNITDMKIDSYEESGRVNSLTIVGSSGSKTLKKEEIRTFFSPSLDSRMFSMVSDGAIVSDSITVQGDSLTMNKTLDNIKLYAADGIEKEVALGSSLYVVDGNGATKTYSMQSQNTSVASGTFVLNGKGYGHGVGMSQYGAKGMADAKFSYIDILKSYYTGVTIK
jgi:stage II sporulation protein D